MKELGLLAGSKTEPSQADTPSGSRHRSDEDEKDEEEEQSESQAA